MTKLLFNANSLYQTHVTLKNDRLAQKKQKTKNKKKQADYSNHTFEEIVDL